MKIFYCFFLLISFVVNIQFNIPSKSLAFPSHLFSRNNDHILSFQMRGDLSGKFGTDVGIYESPRDQLGDVIFHVCVKSVDSSIKFSHVTKGSSTIDAFDFILIPDVQIPNLDGKFVCFKMVLGRLFFRYEYDSINVHYKSSISGMNKLELKNILIFDVNINYPQFIRLPYHVKWKENSDTEFFDGVYAYDLDEQGTSATNLLFECQIACEKIQLELMGKYQYFNLSIDRSIDVVGVRINLVEPVDYEQITTMAIQIDSSDQGDVRLEEYGPLTTESFIVVEIIDQPDQPPIFLNTPYNIELKETQQTSLIGKVTAIDGDKGINASIRYSFLTTAKINTLNNLNFEISDLNIILSNTEQLEDYIEIDPNTGELYLTNELYNDEECSADNSEFSILKFFSDYGKYVSIGILAEEGQNGSYNNSYVTVVFKMVFENMNIPTFDKDNYEFSIGNDLNGGDLFPIQIIITDCDYAEFGAYSLELNTTDIKVEPDKGESQTALRLSLVNEVFNDCHLHSAHYIELKVIELSGERRTTSHVLHITILSTNMHIPKFLSEPIRKVISEEEPEGSIIETIKIEDKDCGIFQEIRASINSVSPYRIPFDVRRPIEMVNNILTIDLFVSSAINRDDSLQYNFQIVAMDGGNKSSNLFVTIDIKKVNKNPPYFLNTELLNHLNLNCDGYDDTDEGYFIDINEEKKTLTSQQDIQVGTIDNEDELFLKFNFDDNFRMVNVKESSNTISHLPIYEITIPIDSWDDFMDELQNFEFCRSVRLGIGRIYFDYEMVVINDLNITKITEKFTQMPTSNFVPILFILIEKNVPPKANSSNFIMEMNELQDCSFPSDHELLKLENYVSDDNMEGTLNHKLSYYIDNDNSFSDNFVNLNTHRLIEINHENGELSFSHNANWEIIPHTANGIIFLTINIIDDGTPAMQTTITINITVSQISHRLPYFEERNRQIDVEETMKIGEVLYENKAKTENFDSLIIYNLSVVSLTNQTLSEYVKHFFSYENGRVVLEKCLDRSIGSTIVLKLTAIDQLQHCNRELIFEEILMNIQLSDDYLPNFEDSTAVVFNEERLEDCSINSNKIYARNISFAEDIHTNVALVFIKASFKLILPVCYWTNSENFDIDEKLGFVTSKRRHNWDVQKSYNETFFAARHCFVDSKSVIQLLLEVEPVNRFAPKITNTSLNDMENWSIEISEDTELKKNIFRVDGRDDDLACNGTVKYRLINKIIPFNITENGIVYVENHLSYLEQSVYDVIIEVFDNWCRHSNERKLTSILTVELLPENRHTPKFPCLICLADEIDESYDSHNPITFFQSNITFIATDPDPFELGEIHYRIINTTKHDVNETSEIVNMFRINELSGMITPKSSLIDEMGEYSIFVEASDRGEPSKWNIVEIRLEIISAKNLAPQWNDDIQTVYSQTEGYVHIELPQSSMYFANTNTDVFYSLSEAFDGREFSINSISTIQRNQILIIESIHPIKRSCRSSSIILEIQAAKKELESKRCISSKCAKKTIEIFLMDKWNNSAIVSCQSRNLRAEIIENKPNNTIDVVALLNKEFYPTDSRLITRTNVELLNNGTFNGSHLTFENEFDRENQEEYEFILQVISTDGSFNRTNIDRNDPSIFIINLVILDINDNVPQVLVNGKFLDDNRTIEVSLNHKKQYNADIIQFDVFDADRDDNSLMDYHINQDLYSSNSPEYPNSLIFRIETKLNEQPQISFNKRIGSFSVKPKEYIHEPDYWFHIELTVEDRGAFCHATMTNGSCSKIIDVIIYVFSERNSVMLNIDDKMANVERNSPNLKNELKEVLGGDVYIQNIRPTLTNKTIVTFHLIDEDHSIENNEIIVQKLDRSEQMTQLFKRFSIRTIFATNSIDDEDEIDDNGEEKAKRKYVKWLILTSAIAVFILVIIIVMFFLQRKMFQRKLYSLKALESTLFVRKILKIFKRQSSTRNSLTVSEDLFLNSSARKPPLSSIG
ncbi:hypothetical protein SNEBB_006669 [Seison nebaliae]|nr:hypothetical protein SNEBB_006669 [Seison nebaliae]